MSAGLIAMIIESLNLLTFGRGQHEGKCRAGRLANRRFRLSRIDEIRYNSVQLRREKERLSGS